MLGEIMALLRDKGYRVTRQRRCIIEAVAAKDRPVTAGEVWQSVSRRAAGVGLDTVYRNLTTLAELGVVAAIAGTGKGGVRYKLAFAAAHHHHIVCMRCGAAACIDYCPVNREFLALVRSSGFELVRHKMELYGLCPGCRDGKEAEL